jgi:uncharacterized protein
LVIDAIRSAVSQLVCDYFAYADGVEEARYVGLVATGAGHVAIDPSGLLVKPEIALAQIEEDRGRKPPPPDDDADGESEDTDVRSKVPALPRRFYASVMIDPNRAGRDVGRIAEEVLQHLTTLPRAGVRLTLEIEANAPEGMPDDVRRVVTENCQTLKFTSHGFERG